MTVLSPAPLIVLLLFLVVSPVRGLLFPSAAGGAVAGPSRSAVPIVHVVLDELPQSTLADADGRIDAELFPNFARLARESTWYRNATTVNDSTAAAVPAQLTGEQPRAGTLPTTRDHPRSLFTLFERSHELTVIEPITDALPRAPLRRRPAGDGAIGCDRSSPTWRSSCSSCCCRPTCARGSPPSTACGRGSRPTRCPTRASSREGRT